MTVVDYLDSVANTEEEARLVEIIAKHKEEFAPMVKIPVAGAVIAALMELGELKSIDEFKQTAHYDSLKRYDVFVDLDDEVIAVYPGFEMRKKMVKVLGFIIVAVIIFVLWRKCRKK